MTHTQSKKQSRYIPKVTVGISAHNEAGTISTLLHSILSQRGDFILQKIVVVCDGCTDATAKVAEKVATKNPQIVVRDDKRRYGQFRRLEKMYATCSSEIFVALDADTKLAHPKVIHELVAPFKNRRVGLVGGHNTPVSGFTPIARAIIATAKMWYETVRMYKGGHTIHTHHSSISAVRTSLCAGLRFPSTIIANDDFLYFTVIQAGYVYRHAPDAVSYYREPATLHEYLVQATRFITAKEGVISYFGEWTRSYYVLPSNQKLYGIITSFYIQPLEAIAALGLMVTVRFLKNRFVETYRNQQWTRIESSKGALT